MAVSPRCFYALLGSSVIEASLFAVLPDFLAESNSYTAC